MRNSIAHLVVLGLMFALVGCGTTVATNESRYPASLIKASAFSFVAHWCLFLQESWSDD